MTKEKMKFRYKKAAGRQWLEKSQFLQGLNWGLNSYFESCGKEFLPWVEMWGRKKKKETKTICTDVIGCTGTIDQSPTRQTVQVFTEIISATK